MDNELASSLIEIAWTYRHAQKPIPPHLIADLHDVARADTIATRLRSDAQRLLRGAS
jgi:hypothetical protein